MEQEHYKNTVRGSGAEDPGEVLFRGTVARVTYQNESSGFAVIKAEPDSLNEAEGLSLATIVGVLPPAITPGTCFIARGSWQVHPRFGRQFRAWSLTETTPTSKEAIYRYLSSGAIKGFGPILARRVVDMFGDETMQVLDEDPERLRQVPGVGRKKLEEIVASWQEKRTFREVLLFFENHGIPLGLAQRIFNHYGTRAIEIANENPYQLAKEIRGVGFLTADRIAQALGLNPESPERLVAGLVYSLEQSTDEGHCFLPSEQLVKRTAALLQLNKDEMIAQAIHRAALAAELVVDGSDVYLPQLHYAEMQLSYALYRRIGKSGVPAVPIEGKLIEEVAGKAQLVPLSGKTAPDSTPQVIHLSQEQKRALSLAAAGSLLVITGGPGCGKTTVVRAITHLFKRARLRVGLAAPTGRAAQRMAEVCDMSASTIHRLLKYDPMSQTFEHHEHNPLPLDALVVDESSMIDLPLAASLLRAVPPRARMVFVGDADQLPSVGPGLFLGDLLRVAEVPRVELTTLFRRADESLITEIAHKINKGIVPDIPQPDGSSRREAYFLPAADPETAAALVERLTVEQVPKKFNWSGADIIVLSPMNQGPLGIVALNQRLQEKLVPRLPGTPAITSGAMEFRLGDRVCQRVNNYSIHPAGVFNGDQGRIVGIDAQERNIYVDLWDGRTIKYSSDEISQLDLAYALTIHRAQGSEVPVVILALHDTHHIMLERQLIYTGVTRAKKLLLIVGTKRALAVASKRSRSKGRYTRVVPRIERLLGGAAAEDAR